MSMTDRKEHSPNEMIEERDSLLQKCLAYFKERPVFQNVFMGFKDRYESLGHFGGSIKISNPSQEEKDQLSGFLRKDFSGDQSVTISWKGMEKALQNSRFASVDMQELFEAYLGKPLLVKKEEKSRHEEEKVKWLGSFLEIEGGQGAGIEDWIFKMCEKKEADYLYVTSLYQREPQEAQKLMEAVCRAGRRLPCLEEETEELAVFAARVTKNPHFFDAGSRGFRVLVFYLRYLFQERSKKIKAALIEEKLEAEIRKQEEDEEWADADDWNEQEKSAATDWMLLEKAGILRDALSNHILTYQLHAKKKDGGLHQGLEGFYKERQPCILTLKSIQELCEVFGESDSIYMVENPAVFSYLIKKYPKESFLCGNGQLKTAAYRLLERFSSGTSVYYAGDFDPEGLLIAQRLCDCFPEMIHLWQYDTGLYQQGKSEEKISSGRMKKLQGLREPELLAMAGQLRENKAAAYQETVMENFLPGKLV